MKIILGAVLIVIIALLGSRTTFTRVKLPLAARYIYLTGTEYIVVGLCLGSQMLGLLDEPTMRGLDPLLYLALGWIGLMFGIQLEVPQMARFPRQYLLTALLQAAGPLLVCSAAFAALFNALGEPWHLAVGAALAIGAIAVPTAQSSLALIHKDLKLRRNKVMEILGYVAGVDAFLGLAVIGFVFCYMRTGPNSHPDAVVDFVYLVVSIVFGATMGALLHFLTRVRCSQEELFLYTVGVVVFSAGLAASIGMSPLFITATSGFFIANTRGAKARILQVLATMEKPFYIVVLLYGGAMLGPGKGWLTGFALAALYIALRLAGKMAGGFASSAMIKRPIRLPRSIGLGFISQGGMAAAMVVSYYRAFPDDLSGTILLVVLVAIVVNEMISPFLARGVVERGS